MIYSSSSPSMSAAALDDDTLLELLKSPDLSTEWSRLTHLYLDREVHIVRSLQHISPTCAELHRELVERIRLDAGRWRVPEVDAEAGRRELVAMWRDGVSRDQIPSWRRRGPPSWLESYVWMADSTVSTG